MISAGSGTFRHSRLKDVGSITTKHPQVDLTLTSSMTGEYMFFAFFNGRFEKRTSDDAAATLCTSYGYDYDNTRLYITKDNGNFTGAFLNNLKKIYWNFTGSIKLGGAMAANNYQMGGFKANDQSGNMANTLLWNCYLNGGVDTVYFETSDGAATQTTFTTDWHTAAVTLKIYWYLNGATPTAKFYENGVLKATHTTHMPTVALRPFISTHGSGVPFTVYGSSMLYSPGAAP